MQVPDSAVLLAEESDLANDMESLGFARSESDAVYESLPLILNLMVEKLKGKSSKWAGYIDFLPASLPGLPYQWEVRTSWHTCNVMYAAINHKAARRQTAGSLCRKACEGSSAGHLPSMQRQCNRSSTRLQQYGTCSERLWSHGFKTRPLRRPLQKGKTPCGSYTAGRLPSWQHTPSNSGTVASRYEQAQTAPEGSHMLSHQHAAGRVPIARWTGAVARASCVMYLVRNVRVESYAPLQSTTPPCVF